MEEIESQAPKRTPKIKQGSTTREANDSIFFSQFPQENQVSVAVHIQKSKNETNPDTKENPNKLKIWVLRKRVKEEAITPLQWFGTEKRGN